MAVPDAKGSGVQEDVVYAGDLWRDNSALPEVLAAEAAFVVTMMLAVFIVALAQAAVRGLDISCGCFADELADHGTAAIMVALSRDIVLLVPSIWMLMRPNRLLWRIFDTAT